MRVKIKLPDTPSIYQTNMTLGVADMNYGDHLGNDKVLTLAHECRLRFMQTLNMDELKFYGGKLIMADAMVQYMGQGHRGDQITLDLWLTNCTAFGFDFYYQMNKFTNTGPIELARIKTAQLFFDYDKEKLVKAPEKFNQIYNKEL
jgi:acyl-CoA thioester hydrolase